MWKKLMPYIILRKFHGKYEESKMDKLFNDFYKNKTVFVTGHTGFKGSWLSLWLLSLGAKVIGYSLDPLTQEDIFVQAKLSDKLIDIRGDIRDRKKLKYAFDKYKPEIVFHLAAQPIVTVSYEKPIETYEINVIGTLNILECIRNSHLVKAGVIITTDKCYENKEQIWGYRETDTMGGYDPYSSSKGCVELLVASYRNSFLNIKDYEKHKKVISTARAGNVVGGGDFAENRIVPDCIRSLMDDKPIKIRNPRAIRPWQYVLEPLRGYLILASKMYENGTDYSGGWNFGPDFESMVSVETIVNIIIEKWGNGQVEYSCDGNQLHEAGILNLDCTKSKTYLKWQPKINIEDTLTYTVEWYKKYKTEDVYELCLNQVRRYEKSYNL
jgi:CDP-glucose 4,6-dehydratase